MKSRVYLLWRLKPALVIILTGCVPLVEKSPRCQSATLGKTERRITKELGLPTAHYMNGFSLFHDQGKEVQAHFQGGHADALFYYTFDKKISESWLSSVLNMNSKGTPWILEASSKSGRRVYRTTDGKYHAFLSQGNQLLVDTDDFFRKSIHCPGKSILVDDLPECVFAPDHDLARIGMKESSVIRNYGQPIATAFDGAQEYNDGNQSIVVHYKNGRSDAVLYAPDKHKRFNDCWISCLQQLNSLNAWVVSESSKPNEIYYWTPKDDKVARLIKRRSLIVNTLDYEKDRNQATGITDRRKSYFIAVITPCARIWLGETEAAMTQKLGVPTIERKIRVYRDGDLIVRATFDHGTCNRIIYTSERKWKFTDHWVSATLAVNSKGRSWFVFENSTPKKTYYRTFDHKFYARLKEGNNLGVMTETACKRSARDRSDRDQTHQSP